MKVEQDINPYVRLGLGKGATAAQIDAAFCSLSLQYHPDKQPGYKELYTEIAMAYQFLKNPSTKLFFDGLNKSSQKSEVEAAWKLAKDKYAEDVNLLLQRQREEDAERERNLAQEKERVEEENKIHYVLEDVKQAAADLENAMTDAANGKEATFNCLTKLSSILIKLKDAERKINGVKLTSIPVLGVVWSSEESLRIDKAKTLVKTCWGIYDKVDLPALKKKIQKAKESLEFLNIQVKEGEKGLETLNQPNKEGIKMLYGIRLARSKVEKHISDLDYCSGQVLELRSLMKKEIKSLEIKIKQVCESGMLEEERNREKILTAAQLAYLACEKRVLLLKRGVQSTYVESTDDEILRDRDTLILSQNSLIIQLQKELAEKTNQVNELQIQLRSINHEAADEAGKPMCEGEPSKMETNEDNEDVGKIHDFMTTGENSGVINAEKKHGFVSAGEERGNKSAEELGFVRAGEERGNKSAEEQGFVSAGEERGDMSSEEKVGCINADKNKNESVGNTAEKTRHRSCSTSSAKEKDQLSKTLPKFRKWVCLECGLNFGHRVNLTRHKLTHLKVKPFKCTMCDHSTNRNDALKLHIKRNH